MGAADDLSRAPATLASLEQEMAWIATAVQQYVRETLQGND
jgi:hypothetical protein